jgi:hypothetical protein
LKFQVVVIKMPFRGKIIISELKFQVEVIKWFLQKSNDNFRIDISGCSKKVKILEVK